MLTITTNARVQTGQKMYNYKKLSAEPSMLMVGHRSNFTNHCCINVSKCTLSVIGDWVKIRWSIFTYRPNKCKLKCTKLCVCVYTMFY